VNNNFFFPTGAFFSDKKEIFRQCHIWYMGGGGGAVALISLPRVTMPLGRGGVGLCFNLTTRNTGYPGTHSNIRWVPGYKNTRKSEH